MICLDESDIQRIGEMVQARSPEHYPFLVFLDDWRRVVNENSDGWSYWKPGRSCASTLMNLIDTLDKAIREHKPLPPPVLFTRSLAAIRRFATMKKLPVPELKSLVAQREDPAPQKPRALGSARRVED